MSEAGSGSRKLIGEWLIELTEYADLMKRFRADPAGMLAESGLTEEQQGVVKSGDPKAIRDAVRSEYERAEIMLFPMMFFWAAEGAESE